MSIILCFICALCCSCQDRTVELSGGYFYRDEGERIKDILSVQGNREIPATVTAYAFDDYFIIAKQKPKVPADPLYNKQPVYEFGNEYVYYWIIDHRQDTVWGPLGEEEYWRVRAWVGVPPELTP